MKDAIIVGGGIAGATLAWQWHTSGKSICWIADDQASSSHVAAGIFNPVVLKRFSPIWKAQEQLDQFYTFYKEVQKYLVSPLIHSVPIWRRFHDEKERSTWIRKSQREDLTNFMQTKPLDIQLVGIEAAHGFGLVTYSGWLDATMFMNSSMDYFKNREEFLNQEFVHAQLQINDKSVFYNSIEAKHIIFAEGTRVKSNPWFDNLPLQGNKGEVLIIKCPGLKLDQIVKSSVFLMPFSDDLFWVGATYDRDFVSDEVTRDARKFLQLKLDTFLKLPYEIVDHKSGIRPTTMDRRPFVGRHLSENKIYVFNGMGSRASLVAPWAARHLFDLIYEGTALPAEMDIARFRD